MIQTTTSLKEIFKLLDGSFPNKGSDLQIIKDHIQGDTMADFTYSLRSRLEQIRDILHYLNLFIEHFEPADELNYGEIERSLMTTILRASYEPMLTGAMREMARAYRQLDGKRNPELSIAQLYKKKLLEDNATLSKLESSEQYFTRPKKTQAVTNNIMSSGPNDYGQPVLTAPVNFQTPRAKPAGKPSIPQVKPSHQPSVEILKRKENNNIPCCFCNNTSHGTHRCRENLRKLRDKLI